MSRLIKTKYSGSTKHRHRRGQTRASKVVLRARTRRVRQAQITLDLSFSLASTSIVKNACLLWHNGRFLRLDERYGVFKRQKTISDHLPRIPKECVSLFNEWISHHHAPGADRRIRCQSPRVVRTRLSRARLICTFLAHVPRYAPSSRTVNATLIINNDERAPSRETHVALYHLASMSTRQQRGSILSRLFR